MLISIIIPCYNAEKYLSETLDSIKKQTCETWEAICLNDGSTDNTEKILHQYAQKDARFKVFSQANQGVSAARNRALKECKGEYICFIDSDDTVETTFLENLSDNIFKNDVDLSVCNFVRTMNPDIATPHTNISWKLQGYECAEKIMTDKSFHPQICCMLFKREIIETNQLTFTVGCTRGEDWEFFMKYLVHCKSVTYSSEPLYHYRINNTSAMASFNEKSLTSIEAAQRVSQYYERHQSPVKETITQYAVSRSVWKFVILSLLQHNKAIYQKLKQTYDVKAEMRKLYTFPGKAEQISSRLYVISPCLFRWCFYSLGYIHKR